MDDRDIIYNFCFVYCFKDNDSQKGFRAALIGIVFLISLISRLLEGGNRVEEYCLFLQAISLIFVVNSFISSKKTGRSELINDIGIGLFSGLLFMLKPNFIGLIAIYLLTICVYRKDFVDFRKKIAVVLTVFVLTLGVFSLYFVLKGAFGPLIDQVFIFNNIYSQIGVKNRWDILKYLFDQTKPFSYLLIGLPIYYLMILKRKITPIDFFVGLWLVTEITLCFISKRGYHQYFLTFAIPLSIIASFYYKEIEIRVGRGLIKTVLFLALLSLILILNINQYKSVINKLNDNKPFNSKLIYRSFLYNNFQEHQQSLDFIANNTVPTDKIIIWGSEPSLLFISNRKSVDEYYYQYRLFLQGYDNHEVKISQLVRDVENKKPKIIIDASFSTVDLDLGEFPQSPPLEKNSYMTWLEKTGNTESKHILSLIDFVSMGYNLVSSTYEGHWNLYLRK